MQVQDAVSVPLRGKEGAGRNRAARVLSEKLSFRPLAG